MKRREAFATTNPYSVATIGFGDAYLYYKGVLCYTLDEKLRILNLHDSASHEVVISIPEMLINANPEIGVQSRGLFQVLYCSNNIISCLYKTSGLEANSWLIAFSIESGEILLLRELQSTERIFVRHDGAYLYYGTHSEYGSNNHKEWVIYGYTFIQRKWFDQNIHLTDLVGSEIGSTICFEFHDGYFYALSNQTLFDVEEIDWTSFYHCVRFPLASPCKDLIEKADNQDMWRRQHEEGPIDDRWTSLRLDKDESTGELRIIETRKEWYRGASTSQRTYYTTPIVFLQNFNHKDDNIGYSASTSFSLDATASSSYVQRGPSSSSNTQLSAFEGNNNHDDRDLSEYPDDPILRLLRKEDNPQYMPARMRLPEFTHPGYDGSSNLTFTLAKTRLRYYDTSSSTFLDIVDEPLPTDWQTKQRLRIRAGSRKIGPPLLYPSDHPEKAGLLRSPPSDTGDALNQMYRNSDVTYWPPAQDPKVENEALDQLYRLLNPPTHLGNAEGTADERSIVYATGGYDSPQAIIFVSFDPAIKLAGCKKWGGMTMKGVGEGPHIDGRATGNANEHDQTMYDDALEADRIIVRKRKGKGKEAPKKKQKCQDTAVITGLDSVNGRASVNIQETEHSGSSAGVSWIWHEEAMYQNIGQVFYFGKDKETIK